MKAEKRILCVRDLEKIFTLHLLGGVEVVALSNLSFDLDQGDFAVLTGPSGAGKSSVLQCIFGTYTPTRGSIQYLGQDDLWVDLARCSERRILELRKREISYVTQFLQCPPRVPAEMVVAAPRVLQGLCLDQALEEAREMLMRLKIPERLWRAFPMTFSGGERQRVNLARALIARPRLLLMDEPTASLDTLATASLKEVLSERKSQGTTVLAVFHELGHVESLVTRIIPLIAKELHKHSGLPRSLPARHAQELWRGLP